LKINSLLAGTLALVLVAGLVTPAFADPANGPDVPVILSTEQIAQLNAGPYAEIGDAGTFPASAQIPVGSGALTAITGTLESTGDVDMFRICINDVNSWEAITGQRQFDTMLQLFETNGDGVQRDDDNTPPGGLGSRIDNQPSFSPTSTGFYMLAMTSFHNDALDGGVMMHFGGSTEFGQEQLIGTLDGWDFGNGAGSGTYEILLTGVSFDACDIVGGELLSINTTALILAGAQTNAVWLMSALAVIGSVAFGVLYITSKKN